MRMKLKQKPNSMIFFKNIIKKTKGLNKKQIEVYELTQKIGWEDTDIEGHKGKKEEKDR